MKKPLLLLDNNSLLRVLHQGHFRVEEISFEEAKAIVDMHESREVKRCFQNDDIADLLYRHLAIPARNFDYLEVDDLKIEQDAIAFRLYTTPSETQPSIRTEYGIEATKIQNVYVYCQYLTKYDPKVLTQQSTQDEQA
ncbi:MAG: hypothetical protein RR867_01415 [Ruthenibacterium sp.]